MGCLDIYTEMTPNVVSGSFAYLFARENIRKCTKQKWNNLKTICSISFYVTFKHSIIYGYMLHV